MFGRGIPPIALWIALMKVAQSNPVGSSAEPEKVIWAFMSELASNKVTCIKLARVQWALLNRLANGLISIRYPKILTMKHHGIQELL